MPTGTLIAPTRPSTFDPIEDATRRQFITGVGAAALAAAFLAACGSDDDPAEEDAAAGEAGWPVTIGHAFGETTIEAEPKRVVTVGFTDHDILLALGVVPVGLRDWYGDYPMGVWPWAQDALGDAAPTKLTGELDFEGIAALKPDLILGLYVGLTEDEYTTLAGIAPTVAQSGDHPSYGTPWQEMTRTAAQAVGRTAEADRLIAAVDDQIARVREEHPEFEGLELVYAGMAEGEQYYVETASSTRVAILTSLGFVVPEEINELATDSFYVPISPEQIKLLDRDVIFWELGAAEGMRPVIEANPLYQSLDAAHEGRAVFVDDPVTAGALAHADVLSIPFFLDTIVPRLVAAIDGDPATSSD